MKENVFDVLIYLFENYINDDADEVELNQDREELKHELMEAGFQHHAIGKALDWLEGLAELRTGAEQAVAPGQSIRIYSDLECEKLDAECRGFMLFLEQMGVLDHTTREMVIDRVMALDGNEIDLEQLKWVILMVLFNQPGREAAFAWMEDLVLDEAAGILH